MNRKRHHAPPRSGSAQRAATKGPQTPTGPRTPFADREQALPRSPGNAALQRILEGHATGGSALTPGVREKLEASSGMSLRGVRVLDDRAAHDATAAAGAEAFAHGNHIYVARDAPRPSTIAGRELLAHEVAHVIQQRRATRTGPPLPRGADRFEAAAEAAARRAFRGEAATEAGVTGAPPAVQFQFKHNAAGRPEVEQAVRHFLESALAAQGGTRLVLTAAVENALRNLARAPRPGTRSADPGAVARMDILLANTALVPREPAKLARRVAGILPSPFDRGALERLAATPASHVAPSVGLGDVAERTATPELEPPPAPTAAEKTEHELDIGYAMAGEDRPSSIGPYEVPALRIGRVLGGLGDVAERSELPAKAPPVQLPASVRRAVSETARNALTPPTAGGVPSPDAYPDGRVIAADLARRLQLGRRAGQPLIELRLPSSYSDVKGQERLRRQIEAFALRILKTFPAAGPATPSVDIFFGDRWVTRVH